MVEEVTGGMTMTILTFLGVVDICESDNYGTIQLRLAFDLLESASQVITYQQIGYLKDTNQDSGEVQFQTRYYAEVELLDEQVVDPDGKALERLIVEPEAVVALLGDGWGERGAVLLKLALDARNKIVG